MYNANYTIFHKFFQKNLERECSYIYVRFHILFLILYNFEKKRQTIMQSWELDAYNKRSANQPREKYTRMLKEIDR